MEAGQTTILLDKNAQHPFWELVNLNCQYGLQGFCSFGIAMMCKKVF